MSNLKPNRRAAIYARFSSDLQQDRSIEDQFALCETYAERTAARVVARFSDRARSGTSIFGREGLLDLMESAREGAFDVVIVEALDRLSRDQEDLAGIYKRLSFANIGIEAVHDGVADHIQIGVRGLLGALYIEDLKHKTRRGMVGVVKEARTAGGKSYGYRPVPGKPGELEIVPEEAEVIRRIFRDYVEGDTPREIAARLNRERIAPPRGTQWSASTINGNMARGYGLLLNPLYVGEIVWNRVKMVRDPDTGKRLNRVNPKCEWVTSARPELAIVERETWDAAQRRKQSRSSGGGWSLARPRRLLSGLIKCGACGSAMAVRGNDNGRRRVVCSRAREAGTCSHRRTLYVHKIEEAVIDSLLNTMSHPELVREYLRVYREETKRLTSDARRNERTLRRSLADAERKVDQLFDMVGDPSIPPDKLRERLRNAEMERARINRELELIEAETPVVHLLPETTKRWKEDLENLRGRLAEIDARDPVAKRVRELIDAVSIIPGPPGAPVQFQITGKLPILLGGPDGSVLSMVAGVGIEPTTSGL